MATATTCKLCGDGFSGDRGEPFHTHRGKTCLKCLKKHDLSCLCYDHRIFRRDPALAGAIAGAKSRATSYE